MDVFKRIQIYTNDLFVELFRYASRKLKLESLPEVLNDPKLAKQEFKKLPTPIDEKTCIVIMEGFYEVLSFFNEYPRDK